MAKGKADFYQDRARLLRSEAERVSLDETRWELLNLARLFERLAARIREREWIREAAD
jgi:hypothetical protein